MLNLEIPHDPGYTLALSVRRRADRAHFDFASGTFVAAPPAARTAPLAEGTGLDAGLYGLSYGPTPGATQWWDGLYLLTVHVLANAPYAPAGSYALPVPRAAFRLDVEFASGNSLYGPPPFYTY